MNRDANDVIRGTEADPEPGQVWWNSIHKYVRVLRFDAGLVYFEKDMGLHVGRMTLELFKTQSHREFGWP